MDGIINQKKGWQVDHNILQFICMNVLVAFKRNKPKSNLSGLKDCQYTHYILKYIIEP